MNWQHLIALQISGNGQINLLSEIHQTGFAFSDPAKALINAISTGRLSLEEEQKLLRFTVTAVLSSFYRVNQYFQFDKQAEEELLLVYQQLLRDVKGSKGVAIDYNSLAEKHYLRLQEWLLQKQPEAVLLYPTSQPKIESPVVCAEYRVATQWQVLNIGMAGLQEPILDIGCGKEHYLVSYLQEKGYDVYGMDRDTLPGEKVFKESWLDYDFKPLYWGTIISHLSFTNHFRHHHLKADSNHLRYAKKYIQILQSLKPGGRFYYAPDLPFIEVFLNPAQYSIAKAPVAHTDFYSVCIERFC